MYRELFIEPIGFLSALNSLSRFESSVRTISSIKIVNRTYIGNLPLNGRSSLSSVRLSDLYSIVYSYT